MHRLEPVGMVSNDAYIWKFSFINGVVVEFRVENQSQLVFN